jgi:phospholipase/carboxylesterase
MTDHSDLGFIHRFIPAENSGRTPLLLLHGTGADENDLLPLARELAPGAALLSPRGRVLEGGMPRFFRRVGEGVFDVEDLNVRTKELAEFVAKAREAYGIAKPIALGFSNGANIAWSLLLSNPDSLAGAILMRAMLPFTPAAIPRLDRKPILLLSGDSDPLIPASLRDPLAKLLKEAGADLEYEIVRGSHRLTQQDLQIASEWLGRH